MSYFGWLLSMSASLARYVWPVTVILLAGLMISLYLQLQRLRAVPWRVVAVGFVFPLAILLVGSFWRATGREWRPHSHAVWVIYGLLGVHILTIAVATARARGARWVVSTLGASQVWSSVGCAFVSLMSVTGDWL